MPIATPGIPPTATTATAAARARTARHTGARPVARQIAVAVPQMNSSAPPSQRDPQVCGERQLGMRQRCLGRSGHRDHATQHRKVHHAEHSSGETRTRVALGGVGSAALLAWFGSAMLVYTGLKPPLAYSVFSASACALLLALYEHRGQRRVNLNR